MLRAEPEDFKTHWTAAKAKGTTEEIVKPVPTFDSTG